MGFDALSGPNWIVPTAPSGDSSNRVADTAFVTSAVAAGTTGFVLQTVYNETTSLIVATSVMQGNFTSIPVKTDGLQILTATITPVSTTSKLLIRSVAPVSSSSGNQLIVALYQDTTTAAIASDITYAIAGAVSNASIVLNMTAGTTGPTTFKINVMNFSTVVTTWAVNGSANLAGAPAQYMGGSMRATLVIQETHG